MQCTMPKFYCNTYGVVHYQSVGWLHARYVRFDTVRTEPEKITYSRLTNDKNIGKTEIQNDILYKVISQSTGLSKEL